MESDKFQNKMFRVVIAICAVFILLAKCSLKINDFLLGELGYIPVFWIMSKVVFRNYNLKAVRLLLKEVGKERYECALKDAGITQKPLSLKGFFFEYEMDTERIHLNLYYRYPSRITFLIMPVLGYWSVPYDGWEMARKE